jgi:hypothetical protein
MKDISYYTYLKIKKKHFQKTATTMKVKYIDGFQEEYIIETNQSFQLPIFLEVDYTTLHFIAIVDEDVEPTHKFVIPSHTALLERFSNQIPNFKMGIPILVRK